MRLMTAIRIGPKNTNLAEDIKILLPVKFRWILFSGFKRGVENGSANQRPGRPSCFSDRPEKYKLGRGRWDLASCQVSLNSVQWFREEVEIFSVNQRPGQSSCFTDWPEKHKLGREHWDIASSQVSLNSVQLLQRRSRKCLSQSETRVAILFSDRPENPNLVVWNAKLTETQIFREITIEIKSSLFN